MSAFTREIERVAGQAARDYLHSDGFKAQLRKHIRWTREGFAPGYKLADRERFTATVADRIDRFARRRVRLFGIPLWKAKMDRAWVEDQAEQMVTEFLKDSDIQFCDPDFHWDDGHEIADENMSYWEAV